MKKIAIIYLSYHCDPHIDDAVSAWKKLTYPKDKIAIVIVDNPHPQFGSSMRVLSEQVLSLSGKELPDVVLLPQSENLGFAGGNNAGIRWALDHNFDYIYLHNDDGFMVFNCLEPVIEAMEKDTNIGLAQSLMLLYPDTEFVNSAGNAFHYLGFGFCNNYRTRVSDLPAGLVRDIAYTSGAAVMLRADLLRKFGLWNPDFFMYHEDMEYSLRLRLAGYRAVLVRDSLFYHKYQFGRSIEKFYWMERNRFAVLFLFFRVPTLILIAPMLLFMEIGQWMFAFKSGAIDVRLRVYRYWLNIDNWKLWLKKRRYVQSIRQVSDRTLLKDASAAIKFQEKAMNNPILTCIGNPVMIAYYWVAVRGLVWW